MTIWIKFANIYFKEGFACQRKKIRKTKRTKKTSKKIIPTSLSVLMARLFVIQILSPRLLHQVWRVKVSRWVIMCIVDKNQKFTGDLAIKFLAHEGNDICEDAHVVLENQ